MSRPPLLPTVADGDIPSYVTAAVEQVLALGGDSDRVLRMLGRSHVPMVVVDGDRRHAEVNRAARLLFRLKLAELRDLRIDDMTPSELLSTTISAWAALMATGYAMGHSEVASLDGGRFAVVYCAALDVLPGRHVIALAPAGWSDMELCDTGVATGMADQRPLSLREREILELAADGLSGPSIARRLVLSPATVRTHFANIYEKLAVSDRAAAVARAMRLGLIG